MADGRDSFGPAVKPLNVNMTNVMERALVVIPGGTSSAWRSVYNEGIVRTQGGYVWNVEGRRYIDFLCAWGPIVIGHCDPRVNAAAHPAGAARIGVRRSR